MLFTGGHSLCPLRDMSARLDELVNVMARIVILMLVGLKMASVLPFPDCQI